MPIMAAWNHLHVVVFFHSLVVIARLAQQLDRVLKVGYHSSLNHLHVVVLLFHVLGQDCRKLVKNSTERTLGTLGKEVLLHENDSSCHDSPPEDCQVIMPTWQWEDKCLSLFEQTSWIHQKNCESFFSFSAFFWLLSLLISSIWWMVVSPLKTQLAFGMSFSVIFQELFRFAYYKLIK